MIVHPHMTPVLSLYSYCYADLRSLSDFQSVYISEFPLIYTPDKQGGGVYREPNENLIVPTLF